MHMCSDLVPSTGEHVSLQPHGAQTSVTDSTAKAYLKGASHNVKALSKLLRELCQTQDPVKRQESALNLQREVTELKTLLSSGNLQVLASFVSCLGRLVVSIKDSPKPPNPSVLRTLTNAVDFLRQLTESGCDCRPVEKNPLRLMVVDDDAICRRAMALALSSGDLKLVVCENGVKALDALREEAFDTIFLDIMMPGINGLVVARTIRELPVNRETPIVFVTCLSDFKTRSESILSGGCDLVGKPVSPVEILVKAYTLALRKRLSTGELGGPAAPKAAARAVADAEHAAGKTVTCVGVLHVKHDGTIDTYDQDCFRLLGYSPAEVRGQHIEALFPPSLQTHPDALSRLLFETAQKPVDLHIQGRRKDASVVALNATFSAFFANKTSRMLFLKLANDSARSEVPAAAAEAADYAQPPAQQSIAEPVAPVAQYQTSNYTPPVLPEVTGRCMSTHDIEQDGLVKTVDDLEEKLRNASRALADAHAALKVEQDCRLVLEGQVNTLRNGPTPSRNNAPKQGAESDIIQNLQTQLILLSRELESERTKRKDLERQLEMLVTRRPEAPEGIPRDQRFNPGSIPEAEPRRS